jgi:hypothetical protein
MLRESRVENMEQKQKITVSVVPIPPLGTNRSTISGICHRLSLFPTLFTTDSREQRRRALEFGAMHHHLKDVG